jgi:hypothetical protein
MKKILKPLAFFIAATTLAGTALADSWGYYGVDRSWIGIDAGEGPTPYSLDGSGSPAFQGADLGEIAQGDSLTIVSYDTKTWKNGADISACQYFYKINDGEDVSMGGRWMADLGGNDQKWGNDAVNADVAAGLAPGTYTLSVHGKITGSTDPAGDIWEPGETTYYSATFTIAAPVAYVAQIEGGAQYVSLAAAVAAAADGDTITLLADDNVSLTDGGEITIDKTLTITGAVDAGNGEPLYTIYGKPSVAGANDIFVNGSGTVTLSNVKIAQFGSEAASDIGHAPVYVSSHFTGTFNMDNVYISEFNRGGLFLYGGSEFTVTDCYIDCANSRSDAFTKGIEIKGSANGTIKDTVIVNMERSSATYSTAGIEIYGSGDIVVDGCNIISDSGSHESVKATYGIVAQRVGAHDPSGGTLLVTNCWIDVSNAALSIADNDTYGPVEGYTVVVDGEDTYFGNYIATWSADSGITINAGEFTADVYADAGTITITGGTFNEFAPDSDTGTIVISGGTFDTPVPAGYCAEGLAPLDNGDDTYGVAPAQTVTFNVNGEGASCPVETVQCGRGGVYFGFEKPEWSGHKFLGWFTDSTGGTRIKMGTEVTEDAERTLYAHWSDSQTVTFDLNDGGAGATCSKESVVCIVGGNYSGFPAPAWADHKFLGWYDAAEGGTRVKAGQAVTSASTRTLYAHWAALQTVNFNLNDGGEGATCSKESVTCNVGGNYAGFPAPVWANHKFLGWYDAAEGGARVKGGMPVTDDASRTLYAHWRANAAPLAISGFSMSFRSARAKRSTTTVQDVLTADSLGLSGSYANFSGKTATSTAVYAGQAMNGSGTIQMRSKNSNSGIVTTGSGGKVAKVAIDWSSGKKVDIYGKNSAYSAATDLYDSSTQGTLIGSITNSSELAITDEYAFIGLRSNDGAVYLNSVTIDWTVEGEDPPPSTDPTVTLVASAEEVYVGETVTIEATAANFSGDVTWTWFVGEDEAQETTSTFTLDTSVAGTYEVTAWAIDEDDNEDADASVTITVKDPVVTLTPSATSVEVGEAVTIAATTEGFSGEVEWTWTVNNVEDSTTTAILTLDTSVAGSYEVVAMASSGIAIGVSDPVTITVSEHVEVTGDVLTLATTGVTGGYTGWTATGDSGTKYAGTTAANNGNIQMNASTSSSKRGIVITESTGRDVKSVAVAWGSDPGTRTLAIYGSTTAYSGPSDLSGDNKGTLLGSLTSSQTTLNVDAGYPYIGIYAPDGAVYVASVTIEFASATPKVTLAASATEVEVGETVTITATATGFSGDVEWIWFVGEDEAQETTSTFTLNTSVAGTYEVTAWAIDEDDNEDAEASVTITVTQPTVKYAITVDSGIQHGTVTTTPADEAAEGVEVTVSYTADAGYVLDTLTYNGTPIVDNKFSMPAVAVTVSATFKEIPTYTLVETKEDFVLGAKYLVVAHKSGSYTDAMKNVASGTRIGVEGVTLAGTSISTGSDALVWEILPGAAKGQYVFYNEANGVYAAAPASAGNNARLIEDRESEYVQWTLDFTDQPAVNIGSVKYDDRTLQRNKDTGNAYFATYTSAQTAPSFYRLASQPVQRVTFDVNDGGEGATCPKAAGTYLREGTYSEFEMPVWENHKFLGWFDAAEGGTRIKAGMDVSDTDTRTLYAHWSDSQTVTFDLNDGGAGAVCSKESVVCIVGGNYSGFPAPTWADHKFLGWYDAAEGGTRVKAGQAVTSASTRTLYAHWATLQTVHFNLNDGGEGATCSKESVTCNVGGNYSGFPAPVWADHKFLGWYDAAEGGARVKGGMPVTDDASRTLYAHWRANAAPLAISGFSISPRSASLARDARADTVEVTLWLEMIADVTYEVQWTPSLDGEWTARKRWTADDDGVRGIPVSIPAGYSTGFFRLVQVDVD